MHHHRIASQYEPLVSIFLVILLIVVTLYKRGHKVIELFVFVKRMRSLPRIAPHRFLLGKVYEFWANQGEYLIIYEAGRGIN